MKENGIILVDLMDMKHSSIPLITIGIDFYEYEISGEYTNFRGFLEIPIQDCHIVYWNTELLGRSSRIFYWNYDDYVSQFENEKFLVLKWIDEELLILKSDEDQHKKMVDSYHRMEFIGRMKSFSYNEYENWKQLSNYIHLDTIKKIRPIQPWTHSGLLKRENEYLKKYFSKNQKFTEDLNNHQSLSHFTDFNILIKNDKLTPSELTMFNFDKSTLVKKLMKNIFNENEDEFFGEFQYCFVMFILGHCYDALEQWERFIVILCQCNQLTSDEHWISFWKKFMNILFIQLNILPIEFLIEEPSNTIFESLRQFFDLSEIAPNDLSKFMIKMKTEFEKKFGISLELRDDDEYAPTIYYEN